MKILLIDSGVGGLSIFNYLKNKYPNNEYTFLMDNKNFPYGEKSREEMHDILVEQIKPQTKNFDYVIIACNTLSTIIVEDEVKLLSPTITMMDLHKITSMKYLSQEVNILCTNLSAKSSIWKDIYPNSNIINGENLANWIENKEPSKIYNFINKLPLDKPIILSCTHYNFIKSWIANSVDVTPSLDFLIANSEDEYKFTLITTGEKISEQSLETFIHE